MRNRKREQRLIRVITLLDGAELGHDRERIMDLLHSARRASREGDATVASPLCFKSVKALSSVSGRLQAAGAAAETLEPVDVFARQADIPPLVLWQAVSSGKRISGIRVPVALKAAGQLLFEPEAVERFVTEYHNLHAKN
ncbi:TPA: hypothetical protein KUM96_004332 [Serratia marcescens]|nr:hypothetical protein [Serratia marcescens]